MSTSSPLLLFFSLVLLFSQKTTANGSINTTMKDQVAGLVGAIVDQSSRIGKEEKIAMEIAINDVYEKTNQSFHLHIMNSQKDPMQAALAGVSWLLFSTNKLCFKLSFFFIQAIPFTCQYNST